MRVALIHYSVPPVIGGVERVMEEHARLFVTHGHEVTLVSLRGGRGESGSITSVTLPADASSTAQVQALRPVLSGQDLVLVHNVMTMPFHLGLTEALGQLADELTGVRFVGWTHDVAACNPDYPPVPALLHRAHPRFQYVAVSPLRQRQFAEVSGMSLERCPVVPNGLDPVRVLGLNPVVEKLVDDFHLLDGRLVLLHPTRLLRRKNVELSLGIIAALKRMGRAATLLITGAQDPHQAGAGEYVAGIREFCARLGVEGEALLVSDHFVVGDAELAGLYRLADALVFPSFQEGFGLPVLEAALHRLPVFCSDIEPLRDAWAENRTFFSPEADPELVARLIVDTLEASAAYRERRRVLGYAWERVWERYLAPLQAGRQLMGE